MSLSRQILDALRKAKAALTQGGPSTSDLARWQPRWTIEKYRGCVAAECLYAVEEINGNLLLTEGVQEMLKLLIGAGGTTAFSNANARLGVGDSSTAADAAQTDLLGANKTYRAMDTGYPTVANNVVTFKATFSENDANHDWQEFVVDNGAAGAKTLNRKVESHGAKASGDIWVLTLSVTIS